MRPLRDVVGEAMRRERLGLIRPPWADAPEEIREEWRIRADVVIRIMGEAGVTFGGRISEATTSDTIYRYATLDGKAERVIRRGEADAWEVVTVKPGQPERVEQSFTMARVHIESGMVLVDDPDARKLEGLGRRFAAALEIHRMHAAGGSNGR